MGYNPFANVDELDPSPFVDKVGGGLSGLYKGAGSSLGNMNPFKSGSSGSQASDQLAAAAKQYSDLSPPKLTPLQVAYAKYSGVGPSELGGVKLNPEYVKTQDEQLGALRNLANRGGHDAASDAELAQIQAKANTNAKGQQGAIMQNMAARGQGGSGASLLAQLSNSQNQTNNQSLQDLGVRGQNEQTALAARMGAGQLGSQMQQNDYNQQAAKAQANDAINRFNAQNNAQMSLSNAQMNNAGQQYNTGLQQTGYQNQFNKAAGISGVNLAAAKHYDTLADIDARRQGGMLSGGIGITSALLQAGGKNGAFGSGGALADWFGGGGGGATAGTTGTGIIDGVSGGITGASQAVEPGMALTDQWHSTRSPYNGYAAGGGKIPGISPVPGNSFKNDTVQMMESPGEVVVPRSMTHASNDVIGNFVHHPPTAGQDPEREYKLAALKHLFGRK